MTWVRLDDGFADHPKLEQISDYAFRLHVSAMCWSSRRGTDGRISKRDLYTLASRLVSFEGNPLDLATELTDFELWHTTEYGYWFPLRTRHNPAEKTHHETREHRKHRRIVLSRDGYKCRYCTRREFLTLDHIVPPSKGGSHDPTNLVTACRSCNSRKGSRTPQSASMPLLPIEVSS